MSDTSTFITKKHELNDFIALESGTKFVTLTFFNSRMHGVPGWTQVVELDPELALEIAADLKRRALDIKER